VHNHLVRGALEPLPDETSRGAARTLFDGRFVVGGDQWVLSGRRAVSGAGARGRSYWSGMP
jgi:hypothetical protein